MPRRSKLEAQLDRLADLRDESDEAIVRHEVGEFLRNRNHHVVARAAKRAGERGFEDFIDLLVEAFDRFLENPIKSDKGCVAKAAIVRALVDLEARAEDVYLRGVRYRQLEPAYGGSTDAAVPVRAASAEGLLLARHPDLGRELADLLADPETDARLAAARVLAASGRPEAEPVLRLKARLGDSEPEVTGEALAGLLAIEPRHSLDFVALFLNNDDDTLVEAAALALGESRLDEALPLLVRSFETSFEPRLRKTLLVAISMLRRQPGFDFLLSLVAEGRPRDARLALAALGIQRGNSRLREQVEADLAARDDASELRAVFEREFR